MAVHAYKPKYNDLISVNGQIYRISNEIEGYPFEFAQEQLKLNKGKISYEWVLNNINDISLQILRQNKDIYFSEKEWETLTLIQEMCGGLRGIKKTNSSIYVIPTGDKPIKVVLEG